jgi:hypothetical protein
MRFQKFSYSGEGSSGKNTELLLMGTAITNLEKCMGVFLYRLGPGRSQMLSISINFVYNFLFQYGECLMKRKEKTGAINKDAHVNTTWSVRSVNHPVFQKIFLKLNQFLSLAERVSRHLLSRYRENELL